MKLLYGYTLDYVKRNRRSSLAIMVAILMTSTMLSALCGYLYNLYTDNLRLILYQTGHWHGELYDDTPGSKLSIIEGFDSIQSVMIKGDWKTGKIDDPRRSYLLWRDASSEYWESMPEGRSAILEGRIPTKTDEIALSKQYFEHHPELAIGDTITLPLGDRVAADGSVLDPREQQQQEERFVPAGLVTLTVVGKLDAVTSSSTPAYTALGYLEPGQIAPDDDITIYFRFKNIHDTYLELPKIAAAAGYQPDEYGQYLLRYNAAYLSRRGVLSPEQRNVISLLWANQMPLMFGVIGLLVVGLFILVIHNAFAMSANARLSHLGIFSSIGASPKQIKHSVVLEALLLTALPLPLGLFLGQLSVKLMMEYISQTTMPAYDQHPIFYTIGWQSLLPAVLLTLLTVWWSAMIPARRVAKLSPIDAIRKGGTQKLQKLNRFTPAKLFGLSDELAQNALRARRKSYRTATVSLTLSCLILAVFFCIHSAQTASKAIYQSNIKRWENQDINVTLNNVTTANDYSSITQQISGLNAVSSSCWYNTLRASLWLTPDAFSDEFNSAGSFDAAGKFRSTASLPLLRDGQRRVDTIIIGLDNDSFAEYCKELGLDPALFYQNGQWQSIIYYTIEDITKSTKRRTVTIPYLNLAKGDLLNFTEKTSDDYEGDFSFQVEAAAIADQIPAPLSHNISPDYDLLQFMPMSRLNELASSFARHKAQRINGVLCVDSQKSITPTRNSIETLCESYFGSGDYNLFDENEYYELDAASNNLIAVIFSFVAGLLAVIGLSNAWSTVRGTLSARRREFAMLRSVGLPPEGIRKMLMLEAVLLGLKPLLLSLPLVIALQCIFLYINEITLLEWLPFTPWQPVLIYMTGVLTVIFAAYAAGGRKLLRENIIDAVKLDTL